MREERPDIKPAVKAELRASGETEMFCSTSLASVLARHIIRVINVIETQARLGTQGKVQKRCVCRETRPTNKSVQRNEYPNE